MLAVTCKHLHSAARGVWDGLCRRREERREKGEAREIRRKEKVGGERRRNKARGERTTGTVRWCKQNI